MLHWLQFSNSWTSSDIMGYLQGVQMEPITWVNSRNECRKGLYCVKLRTAEMSITNKCEKYNDN